MESIRDVASDRNSKRMEMSGIWWQTGVFQSRRDLLKEGLNANSVILQWYNDFYDDVLSILTLV